MKTSEVLRKAGDVLRERGWCQRVFEDGCGKVCALGSIRVVDADNWIERSRFLVDITGSYIVGDWNDRSGRTAAEVMHALDAAYVLALQEEGIEPADVL